MVRLAGAVDEAGYLAHNQSQAERGAEPVDHFCRRGWRGLRNPSLDFDVWWYWAEYLDPTDESETATNPLVHYLLDGRHRGLLPLPRRLRRATRPRLPAPPRRACLFAAYDPDGLVDDTSSPTSAELARHAEVFVLLDGSLAARTAGPAVGVASPAPGCAPHGGHDFGSWSLLARELVGWDALAAYDEVLLVNDSCWLLRPLDEVFARMDARPGDFWGLQVTARRFEPEPSQPQSVPLAEVKRSWLPPTAFRVAELVHVGSYFLALRRPVLDDRGFRRRLDSVVPQRDRTNLVQKYETGATQYLVGQGYDFWTRGCPSCDPTIRSTVPAPSRCWPRASRSSSGGSWSTTPTTPRGWPTGRSGCSRPSPTRRSAPFERNLLRVADPDALARSLAAGS